jgi:hypothetical protein
LHFSTLDQLAKLKRQQELRRMRAAAKQKKEMTFGFRKEGTTRRCGNCGQLGHMKTSRKCPMWPGLHASSASSDTQSNAGNNKPASST